MTSTHRMVGDDHLRIVPHLDAVHALQPLTPLVGVHPDKGDAGTAFRVLPLASDALDVPTPIATSKLFQPVQIGNITLAHRVVLAPLTRLRANTRGVHTDLAVEHYAQRASVPGTLLITEAASVCRAAEGRSPNAPGVWNDEQIAAWKRVRLSDLLRGCCC